MKKNLFITLICAALVFTLTGCDRSARDRKAADKVAALIDAIYVQERTERTDEQCAAAKKAWDALTDAQKALVEGEEADPDYFGRDTGDASKDNPLNQDGIGENEILVVSFGTSFNDSRAEDIYGIEKAIQAANPGWSVRRAFTAQIIINHVQARENEKIDNMDQALSRAVANGVKNLVIQPTHLMHGAEYDELCEALEKYADRFESLAVAEPLLGEVGKNASVVNADKQAVAVAVTKAAVESAGFSSAAEAADAGVAFVLMGHGTSHTAKVSYSQMATQMAKLSYRNVFIGTVEGEPEETACEEVIEAVKEAGYRKVILRPLMVVAGDHANNDMAGDDEDSWKSMFLASQAFDSVECQIEGLGRIPEVQALYIAHTEAALKKLGFGLDDGLYLASFNTDSSMFHASEATKGKGTLSVFDGKMIFHVSLASKSILNLYSGKAEDAKTDEANWLQPTEDSVTYEDGLTETVYGFDIPVTKLNGEFDLALIGKKGVWYDHKVSVTDIAEKPGLAEGDHEVAVLLSGGTGKVRINSPARVKVSDGVAMMTVVWTSSNYDYMIVDGVKYLNQTPGSKSTFTFPVSDTSKPLDVIANTTAMGNPHEIEYTIGIIY